jgi:hypothetical protein
LSALPPLETEEEFEQVNHGPLLRIAQIVGGKLTSPAGFKERSLGQRPQRNPE